MSRRIVASLAISLTCLGCKGTLEPGDLAGSYEAIRFIFADDTGEIDVLAAGGRLDITLNADGTTTGSLLVPAVVTGDPVDLVADLAGTFTIHDDIISFNQAADTFIRDSDWVQDGNRLTGGGVFSGQTIVVVLFRT